MVLVTVFVCMSACSSVFVAPVFKVRKISCKNVGESCKIDFFGDFNEGWTKRYRKITVPEEMSACVDCMRFNRVKSSTDFQDFGQNPSTKVGFVGLSEVNEISTP